MTPLRITWFKIRALTFANLQRLLGFILRIPVPPKLSVGGFIEREGRFLILDLSYRKGFAFPGGMVEPGENLEQALIREIKEETGLDCISSKFFDSKADIQYGLSVIAAAFKVEISGELNESDEGRLQWKTAEEILENCAYNNWVELFSKYTNKK